jgi:LCP family protein required for cell wall assembly
LLATLAAVMSVVLLIGVGGTYVAVSGILGKVKRVSCPSCVGPTGGKGLNVLIIGSDSRSGLTPAQKRHLHVGSDAGQRSDTIILLHIPANGGKAEMVSLPRDSYVTIPAHCPTGVPPTNGRCKAGAAVVPAAPNKLNAAFSFGGADLTVNTVRANTDVPINHYLVIDFAGFVNMVNRLGGVTVCDAKPISDPVHYDPASGGNVGSGLNIPAGNVTLKGAQALQYVRAREFDPAAGDLGRIQRQQKFMAAMLNKAESAGIALNLFKLDGFLKAVASSLTVDSGLSNGGMISLARKLHSMSPKNVDLLTVPLSDTNYASSVGSAVLWDPVLSKRLFHDFATDTSIKNVIGTRKLTVAPSNIAVTVLNSTNQNGLASRAAAALTGIGFGIQGTPADAPPGSDPAQTVVAYGPSRADSAKTLAAAVPGSVMKEDASLGSRVELLVGSDYSGVTAVKVSSGSHRASVTTGASNPCS